MAFATILNIYKWHYVVISVKAISEGVISEEDTKLVRKRKILLILTSVSLGLIFL